MNNLILQHYTGNLGKLEQLSKRNIEKYAKYIGCDYKFISGQVFRENLTAPCQKIFMLDEIWDVYETVLMLDIDMFVPKMMKDNIFEEKGIGLHDNIQTKLRRRLTKSYPDLGSLNAPYWGGAIYKMDLATRKILRAHLGGDESWMETYNIKWHYEDEGIMHTLAKRSSFMCDHLYLNKKWCQCSYLPNPERAGFIHIRKKITPKGPEQEKIENYRALVDKGIIDAD